MIFPTDQTVHDGVHSAGAAMVPIFLGLSAVAGFLAA